MARRSALGMANGLQDDVVGAAVERLLAVQDIANNLARHSRGVDRNDAALFISTYRAGATVSYGVFEGSAAEFGKALTDSMAGAPTTLHRTSNMWIRLDPDDHARSESYVVAYLKTPEGEAGVQRLVGGRYLDRHVWTKQGWRIDHRTYVMDWNINLASREHAPLDGVSRGVQGDRDPAQQMLSAFRREHSGKGDEVTQHHDGLDYALARMAFHDLRCAYARGLDR